MDNCREMGSTVCITPGLNPASSAPFGSCTQGSSEQPHCPRCPGSSALLSSRMLFRGAAPEEAELICQRFWTSGEQSWIQPHAGSEMPILAGPCQLWTRAQLPHGHSGAAGVSPLPPGQPWHTPELRHPWISLGRQRCPSPRALLARPELGGTRSSLCRAGRQGRSSSARPSCQTHPKATPQRPNSRVGSGSLAGDTGALWSFICGVHRGCCQHPAPISTQCWNKKSQSALSAQLKFRAGTI